MGEYDEIEDYLTNLNRQNSMIGELDMVTPTQGLTAPDVAMPQQRAFATNPVYAINGSAATPTQGLSTSTPAPAATNSKSYTFYQDMVNNNFTKPISEEEREKREKAIRKTQMIGNLGNAFSALSNLVWTNAGAPSQTLPETPQNPVQKYQDRIKAYRDQYLGKLMQAKQMDDSNKYRDDALAEQARRANQQIEYNKWNAEQQRAYNKATKDAQFENQRAIAAMNAASRKYNTDARNAATIQAAAIRANGKDNGGKKTIGVVIPTVNGYAEFKDDAAANAAMLEAIDTMQKNRTLSNEDVSDILNDSTYQMLQSGKLTGKLSDRLVQIVSSNINNDAIARTKLFNAVNEYKKSGRASITQTDAHKSYNSNALSVAKQTKIPPSRRK